MGVTKRRWLVWPVMAVAMVFLAALCYWPRPTVTEANFARIRLGMTKQEVASILGGTGQLLDVAKARDRWNTQRTRPDPAWEKVTEVRYWDDDAGIFVGVGFDDAGTVRVKELEVARITFWERL